MILQDHDYPWVFRRDEIDILEDELEDLYELVARREQDHPFESAILREQIETQERSDQELATRLGFDVLHEVSEFGVCAHGSQTSTQDNSFWWSSELLYVRSHPLYQKAKRWAEALKPFAKRGYEQGGSSAPELFRVYANVNLVPLKIFTALTEELHEDEVGFEIAWEEYRLALTYLERIMDSLESMAFLTDDVEQVAGCRQEAGALREALLLILSNLPRSTKHSL